MTIQTTNIDATSGDAVDLTAGDEAFFTVANGVVLESQIGSGIVADKTANFFIYNYGSIVANSLGMVLENANDHFYNERAGSVFGFEAVVMTAAGETFVNYGDVSGDGIGVFDGIGGNVILNYGTIEGPTGSLDLAGGETITNARGGLIDGAITLVAGGDTFTNAGDIDGAITFTGTGITNTVTNSGGITGNITFSARDSTLTNTGSITGNITIAAVDTLVNHGQIYGNVAAGTSATLTNTGVIHGTVRLGAHDTFTVGDVTGAVTASTNDVLAFSGNFGNVTIDKFVAGSGTTHDVISFAKGGGQFRGPLSPHHHQQQADRTIARSPWPQTPCGR
jgi:hypothetical protein